MGLLAKVCDSREAEELIQKELRNLPTVQADFIDKIVSLYAKKGDRVRFPVFDDGRHLYINGKDIGVFLADKLELAWRAK